MVLVAYLAVIRHVEVNIKGRVKWTGGMFGECMVLVAYLAVVRHLQVDVEGRVVGTGVIVCEY